MIHVASVQVAYRAFWCLQCESVRFHKTQRLTVKKIGNVWMAQFKRRCSGIAPAVLYKTPRMIKECGIERIEWLPLSQWNFLIEAPCYGENAA